MPGFLSCSLTVLICGEVSMLSAWIRKMFDLWVFSDNFDLEGYPRNCLKSLFRKDIFENTWNRCYVFHRQQSFLINEWRKVWNSCHASWTWAAVMLLQSLYFYSFLPNHPRPLSSFDTRARWQPLRRAISQRFHGKIGDCEQSTPSAPPPTRATVSHLHSGGGAFANCTLLGGWAIAIPRAIPELLTRTRRPIRI